MQPNLLTIKRTSALYFHASILLLMMTLGCRSGVQVGEIADGGTDAGFEHLLSLALDAEEKADTGEVELESTATSIKSNPDRPGIANIAIKTDLGDAQSVGDGDEPEFRSLSLHHALTLAIKNSEFVVDSGNFLSPNNPLLNNPQFLQSTYDLEMQKSSQQGVEAALADFDLQIATGVQWGRNSFIPSNSNVSDLAILVSDNGTLYGRLDKPLRSGGSLSVIHNLNYASNAQNILAFDPRYSGYLRGELRHPMMAGRGRTFTDIAGPQSYRNRQLNQGIALAEIAEKTAEIEFQLGLERLLKQTEELYWDCWLAYQVYENQQVAMQNALEIWTRIQNRANNGLAGGGAADEAQAEENYYRRKSLADSALIELEQAAERLSHLIGVHDVASTRLFATDSPVDAPIIFDLESSVSNALKNRNELIKQDLQIQVIEFQLFAAKQLKKPQLDLVSGVQFNGLGDQLFDANGAYSNLIGTDDFGWNVGFEFSMPLGFNRERLNTRYLNLLLAKAMMARQLQEKEIRHEITYTAKAVEKWSQSLTSAKQRLAAAERRLAAVDADFNAGRTSLDLFLRSQDSMAQAKVESARVSAELSKAQLEFLFRQGQTPGLNLTDFTTPNSPSQSFPRDNHAKQVFEPYPLLD